MAYNGASGGGEYNVPSSKAATMNWVTPDERAPNSFVVVSIFGHAQRTHNNKGPEFLPGLCIS
jgi:hypothetical protein